MFGEACVTPATCGFGFGGSSSICSARSAVRVLFGVAGSLVPPATLGFWS